MNIMRTIFYHVALIGMLLYGAVFRIPVLLMKKGKEAKKFARKVCRNWSIGLIWAAKAKVEIIYANDSEEDIKNIVKNDEPVILISNHQSNLDIPTLAGYLPINFGFIAKKEMKHWPIVSIWMKGLNCIFLDRKNARQGMKDMKNAIQMVKNGNSYVIFPEGTRSENGEVGEFKKGSFKLAIDSEVRIVPITIIGTYDIQSKQSLKIYSGKKVKVIVDKPIDYKNLERNNQKKIHIIVNEIVKSNFDKYNDKN